jgi:hypothetical protein
MWLAGGLTIADFPFPDKDDFGERLEVAVDELAEAEVCATVHAVSAHTFTWCLAASRFAVFTNSPMVRWGSTSTFCTSNKECCAPATGSEHQAARGWT